MSHKNIDIARYGALTAHVKAMEIDRDALSGHPKMDEILSAKYSKCLDSCVAIANGEEDEWLEALLKKNDEKYGI